LNQPYPLYDGKRWQIVLGGAVIVFLVLSVFQPFQLHTLTEYKMPILAGYMLVTAVCISIQLYLSPVLFRTYYQHWTMGKNLLSDFLLLILIAFGNSLYHYTLSSGVQSFPHVLAFYVVPTLSVGFIPLVVIAFYQQNRLLRNNLEEAHELNRKLAQRSPVEEEVKEQITFTGNTKETFSVSPDNLLYIEASGNYMNIFYLSEGKVKSTLFRATIKQIEDTLASVPSVIRCHRAFLVNLSHVSSVKGNSQGYHLSLSHLEEEIPVSRTYTKSVREQLK
ncbi:MAG: LytTR family transcriptional regulator, partial [Tannerellaceae bacterium]|nr:LytTR family transcriptional regulator [Tannerellaceae bacterium]